MIKCYCEDNVNNTSNPLDDYSNQVLSDKALKKYNLLAKDFDADYLTSDEYLRKKKKK